MSKKEKKGFNPKSQITGIIVLVLLVILTYFIIRLNVSEINFVGVKNTWHKFNPVYAIPAVICLLGYIFFEGRAMSAVGKPFGLKLGPVRSTVCACIELYFSGLTPSATGGQPAVVYYNSRDGLPAHKSTAMLIMNTLHYTLAMFVLAVVAIILRPNLFFSPETTFNGGGEWFFPLLIIGTILNFGLLAICLMLMFSQKLVRRICGGGLKLLKKMHLIKSYESKMQKLEESLDSYSSCVLTFKSHPLAQIRCLCLNILQRLCVFAIPFFVYLGFNPSGMTTSVLIDILCIQVLSALTVSTLPIPGGVGASELIFISLYSKFYAPDMIQYGMLFSRFFIFYLCMIICAVVSIGNHFRITILNRR